MNKKIGIIGGLGPMASVYFLDLVVKLTDAKNDQEHIDMIITSTASTPDRTEYILDNNKENPILSLKRDALLLEKSNCAGIAVICNTAHYFIDEIQKEISLPFINMVEESVKEALKRKRKKMGILATSGNIKSKLYQNMCEKHGLDYVIPDENNQTKLMHIIYDNIKATKEVEMNLFQDVVDSLIAQGADCLLLGCTELSILRGLKDLDPSLYIDSSKVLAEAVIKFAGKKIKSS